MDGENMAQFLFIVVIIEAIAGSAMRPLSKRRCSGRSLAPHAENRFLAGSSSQSNSPILCSKLPTYGSYISAQCFDPFPTPILLIAFSIVNSRAPSCERIPRGSQAKGLFL